MLEVNIFDRDEMPEDLGVRFHEARSKVVISFFNETLRGIHDGEVFATGWLPEKNLGGEFRIIIQGRRVGAGAEQNRILGPNGKPVVIIPDY